MSKKDKLLKAMKNNPKDVRFEDLKKLLVSYGYEAHNTGGITGSLEKSVVMMKSCLIKSL